MKIDYIKKPVERYVTVVKTPNMERSRTTYECPLCHACVKKRSFDDHAYQVHKGRADEAFALLYGVPLPAKCTCGRDLHYSREHRGFPTTCGMCTTDQQTIDYKSSQDAHNHIEKLEQMLRDARERERSLKIEEKLSNTPLDQLPFPSVRYTAFMKRLSMEIRVAAANGDKDKLFELANFIKSRL